MPSEFKLSVYARTDIKKLFRYSYQQFGESQALKYKTELEACLQLLADNPDLGRKCDHIRQGYQRHEYARHIIFYRKRKTDIFIVKILHESMDAKRHIES